MASGKIKDDGGVRIGVMVFAILLCASVGCFLLYETKKNGSTHNFQGIFSFLFAFGSPLFLGFILWQQLQGRLKFGTAILTLDSIPVKMGEKITGDITVSKSFKDFSGINVRVFCNQVISGGRSEKIILLWDTEQSVDANVVQQFDGQMIIPVTFTIPVGLMPTKNSILGDDIRWGVQAEAVPRHGQHFRTFFSLPVAAANNFS